MTGSRLVVDGAARRGAGSAGGGDLHRRSIRRREADRRSIRRTGLTGAERETSEAMTFDIVTIFPAMVEQPLAAGIVGRAIERGTLDVKVRDLRDFTTDRHRVVDDVPYGGGPGMVLKPEPIFRALDAIEAERGAPLTVHPDVAAGPALHAGGGAAAERPRALVLLCGRYEGVDERVRERVTEEMSIGDYVLTGGELPALVIVDAVARLRAGRGRATSSRWRRIRSAAGCWIFRSSRGRPEIAALQRARRAAVGQPRGDPALAEAGSAEPDARAAAGSAGRRKAGRRRTRDAARA